MTLTLTFQLSQYLDALDEVLPELSGPLWRSTFGKKSSFVVQSMGKNAVSNVAKDVATALGILSGNDDQGMGKNEFKLGRGFATFTTRNGSLLESDLERTLVTT